MRRFAAQAMGTRFELVLEGADDPRVVALGEESLEIVRECEARLSRFASDSLVAHVARRAHCEWVEVDQDTFELFELCREVHRTSAGVFDPSVGSLMDELGFHSPATPAAEARVDFDALELDAGRRALRATRPGLRLDFGSVAKGHALDLVARHLRSRGVERAFLHGGTSSALALGAPPDRDAWLVALEVARGTPRARLCDAALSVSAQHGRRLADGAGHVLDPRAGRSVASEALVAVVHPSAALAEAWSTALLVSGELTTSVPGLAALIGRGSPGSRRWTAFGERAAFTVPTLDLACAPNA